MKVLSRLGLGYDQCSCRWHRMIEGCAWRSWNQAKLIAVTHDINSKLRCRTFKISKPAKVCEPLYPEDGWSWRMVSLLGSGNCESGYPSVASIWRSDDPAGAAVGANVMTPAITYQIGDDYIVLGHQYPSWGTCCSIPLSRMNGHRTGIKEID